MVALNESLSRPGLSPAGLALLALALSVVAIVALRA
jgi:hypothetical protein